MKSLILFLTAMFLTPAAHAENRLGILTGVNFAKMRLANDSQSGTSDGVTGFMGGAFWQLGLTDDFYFEPQLRFSGKGGTERNTTNSDIRIDYLELPFYAKFKVPAGTTFRPFVFAGPALAFKVGARVAGLGGAAVSENFEAFDLGLDLGLGAELALNETVSLSLNGAYSLGLLDTLDGAMEAAARGVSFKNRGLQLYAGLGFAY